ncbi:MAG TPA: patatin-like phospholipase family protein [Pirellulales bacterium]|nr:patatin-like phospholipase family protein [Pirellulales bacterium]
MRRTKTIQQFALCTSKDPDLPQDERFRGAVQILEPELRRARAYLEAKPECRAAIAPDVGMIQETLGIAGGIYKRRWHATTDRKALSQSLGYYEAASSLGIVSDEGYTAINAAFVLDLLAEEELREADDEAEQEVRDVGGQAEQEVREAELRTPAEELKEHAKEIRRKIVEELRPAFEDAREKREHGKPPFNDWWLLVTIAEAHFGLCDYEEAKTALAMANDNKKTVDPWEYEATARQLAHLAMMIENRSVAPNDVRGKEAWEALQVLVGDQIDGLRTLSGKFGLALSGGGFRASFFHIGVLARLAELDLLRHVDVLSCVSGGSIVGAYYYLLLRNLLQEKEEKELNRFDYIDLVKRLEEQFTAFVQTNPRMRAFGNPIRCIRSVLWGAWQPTATAQVLESGLYSPAAGDILERLGQKSEVPLRELFINPKGFVNLNGETDQFEPRKDNWRRKHKVPMLVLNATSLNTGHNWQFTASWFGEPAASINTEVDGNERLRRMYYHEAPDGYGSLTLAQAAAASAAVPGIFWPVTFKKLFEGGRIVRLVDGGVFDNQGATALLDEDCTLMIVSDASGQLPVENSPPRLRFPTLYRSQSIFMGRIRGAEFDQLSSLKRSSLLRDFVFLHLKKDLESPPVDWIGCDNPKQISGVGGAPASSQRLTSYGIRSDIQQRLSGIRTDLDAFCDAEAFALMTSGYCMAAQSLGSSFAGLAAPAHKHPWRFLEILPSMRQTQGTDRLVKVLDAASNIFFKCFLICGISKWVPIIGSLIATALTLALICGLTYLSFTRLGMIAATFVSFTLVILTWFLLGQVSRVGDLVYLRFGSRKPPYE